MAEIERPDFVTDDHILLLQSKGFEGSACVFAIEARYPEITWDQAVHMVKWWESVFMTCASCGDVYPKEDLLFEEENGFYGICDECAEDMQGEE